MDETECPDAQEASSQFLLPVGRCGNRYALMFAFVGHITASPLAYCHLDPVLNISRASSHFVHADQVARQGSRTRCGFTSDGKRFPDVWYLPVLLVGRGPMTN